MPSIQRYSHSTSCIALAAILVRPVRSSSISSFKFLISKLPCNNWIHVNCRKRKREIERERRVLHAFKGSTGGKKA